MDKCKIKGGGGVVRNQDKFCTYNNIGNGSAYKTLRDKNNVLLPTTSFFFLQQHFSRQRHRQEDHKFPTVSAGKVVAFNGERLLKRQRKSDRSSSKQLLLYSCYSFDDF